MKKDRPDIVLMDINQGGEISGIEMTKFLKMRFPYIEVLIISDFEDKTTILGAFRAGAFGYISKKVALANKYI